MAKRDRLSPSAPGHSRALPLLAQGEAMSDESNWPDAEIATIGG